VNINDKIPIVITLINEIIDMKSIAKDEVLVLENTLAILNKIQNKKIEFVYCEKCNCKLKKINLKKHLLKVHNSNMEANDQRKVTSEIDKKLLNKSYVCKKCGKKISEAFRKKHNKICVKKEILVNSEEYTKCSICSVRVKKRNLKKHYKKHNKKDNKQHDIDDELDYKLVQCPECKNKHFKIKEIVSHLMNCHSYSIIKAKDYYFESKNLPEWGEDRKKNDIFYKKRVLLGGGFGLGKNRRH